MGERANVMKKRIILLLCLLLLFVWGSLPFTKPIEQPKQYDLVLIHGFNNRHQWGEEFLRTLVEQWGSHRVYIIYSNHSEKVWTRRINGKTVVMAGENNHKAGNDSIEEQAQIISKKISLLQEKYGLGSQYSIVAHSMGGLVARRVVYLRPNEVVGLVTLGTPHHGTPLAEEYEWLGIFVSGQKAIRDVKPEAVARFNQKYPVSQMPFYNDGKLYTIAGDADGWADRGWKGELAVGWTILSLKYGYDNDGVVIEGQATIEGAEHVKTYMHYNHLELIQKGEVALKIASILP